MPVLEYHLVEGVHADADIASLLLDSSQSYADILKCPIDRIRVYVHLHKPNMVALGGKLVSEGSLPAPYFHFLVLEGRPLSECQQLLATFTDLIADRLQVSRSLVRGGCWPIPPEYWAIAGSPASAIRAQEISARAASPG